MLVSDFEAGLVGLVVFRDVFLIGGAIFQRASSLGWKVRNKNVVLNSCFRFCSRNCRDKDVTLNVYAYLSGKAGLSFSTLMGPVAKRSNHSL